MSFDQAQLPCKNLEFNSKVKATNETSEKANQCKLTNEEKDKNSTKCLPHAMTMSY